MGDIRTFRRAGSRFAAMAAAALLSVSILPAGSAQANEHCPTGNICFWQEAQFNGQKHMEEADDPILACQVLPFAALSVKNHSQHIIRMTSSLNCTAPVGTPAGGVLTPGQEAGDILPPAVSYQIVL